MEMADAGRVERHRVRDLERLQGCRNEMESKEVLPRQSELGAQVLGFLSRWFGARDDLYMAGDLATELESGCAEMEKKLHNLKRKFGTSIVSWGSRSIHAGASVERVVAGLENLGLTASTCQCLSSFSPSIPPMRMKRPLREMKRILGEDLPFIVKELRRISNLRQYAESALKLEALVGDLEDAVLRALNRRTGNDSTIRQSNVHNAVKSVGDAEDTLSRISTSHPQWSHLLKSVDARVDKSLAILRPLILTDYRSSLSSLGWPPKVLAPNIEGGAVSCIPNPLISMREEDRDNYTQSFLVLCALQRLQMRRDDRHLSLSGKKKEGYVGLWAIDELVSPIASKLEHHFWKWTDQPEFIFALAYKITHDFIEGVDYVLQPLIDQARLVSYSAKEAWGFTMVKLLCGFMDKNVLQVLASKYKEKEEIRTSWLHLIDNIVTFDSRMQALIKSDTCLFPGESEVSLPAGISVLSMFHDRPGWLRLWAKIELKDAWKKLKAQWKQEKAWLTDKSQGSGQSLLDSEKDVYLLSTREDYKAPAIAEFAIKITWELIKRCQGLPSVSSRLQFIRSAAIKFLWHFFSLLLHKHERAQFLACGSDESVVKICQLINAATFCKAKLQELSDDVSLLELKMVESGTNNDAMLKNSCFFENEIKNLYELETDWLMEVISHVLRQFENLSVVYLHSMERFEGVVNVGDMDVCSDLVEALDNLKSQLLLIKQHLNPKDFLDLWRSIADGLDHYIFQTVLTRDIRFSNGGAQQFIVDLTALFLIFRCLCVRPESFFRCLRDLLRLLKMDRVEAGLVVSDCDETGKLLSHGLSCISVDQCMIILKNRNFSS